MKSVLPRPLIVLAATIVLVLLGISLVSAATLEVGSSQAYTTIQSAIVAAASGDTVRVRPGTYMEHISFLGKNIVVASTDPTQPDAYIIDGSGTLANTVTFQSGEKRLAQLNGFKLVNNIATNTSDIYISGSNPTITNCILATAGIGINAVSGKPAIDRCTFRGNHNGIASGAACTSTITKCVFTNPYNDGIYFAGPGSAADCTFDGTLSANPTNVHAIDVASKGYTVNLARLQITSCKRGINWWAAAGTIQDSRITACGTGIWWADATGVIANCLFTNGPGSTWFGASTAIYAKTGTVQIVNCTSYHYGVGVMVGEDRENNRFAVGATASIRNCILTKGGYGVLANVGAVDVSYCDVWENWYVITHYQENGNYVGHNYIAMGPGLISVDPLFTGPDYRLPSMVGRWDDATSSWVLDAVNSPCVDAGDPASDFHKEPAPNGGRINMGWEGGTPYASKSVAAPPTLTGSETPGSGTPGTTFTFSATYTQKNNLSATYVKVHILGADANEITDSPFDLVGDGTTNWQSGVTFSRDVVLTDHGLHSYYFEAGDGTDTVRYPASGQQSGPWVDIAPILAFTGATGYITDGVEPNRAPAGSTFTFKVKYSDADGTPPVSVTLFLFNAMTGAAMAGSPFALTSDGTTTWTTGVIFSVDLVLNTATTYQYFFSAYDGFRAARLPASGRILGPLATTAAAPALTISGVSASQVTGCVALSYVLSAPGMVRATIFNLAGRVIAQVPEVTQEAGVQTLRWNGRNATGSLVPTGVYLVQITAGSANGSSASALCTVNLQR